MLLLNPQNVTNQIFGENPLVSCFGMKKAAAHVEWDHHRENKVRELGRVFLDWD